MIEFTNLDIQGFCSIRSLNMMLNNKGITIIRGANGTGKSTIFSALIWCLYGKNPKGVTEVNTWESMRGPNYKGTRVEVFFKKDNQIHHVTRCQNYTEKLLDGAKGASRLTYDIDTTPVSAKFKNDIQDLIVKALGMSYNLFINSVMFGQGISKVVDLSGSDQKFLFEEMFATEYLTKARDLAKEQATYYAFKADELDKERSSLVNARKVARENLREVRELSRTQDKMIAEKTSSLRAKYEENKEKIKSLALGLYTDPTLEARIEEVKEQRSKNYEKLAELQEKVSNLTVKDLILKCIEMLEGQDTSGTLKFLRSVKEDFSKIESCQAKAPSIEGALRVLEKLKYDYDKVSNQIKSLNDEQKSLRERIKEIESSSKNYTSLIEKNQTKVRELKQQISSIESSEEFNRQCDLYKWAYSVPLANSGIKSFLFESSLDSINDSLRRYAHILGFTIDFGIDLESSRKDLVISININGNQTSFKELSGGQKQLVNFAIVLAMNEAITSSKGINIIFLDEVFESLSSNNVELVCEMLSKLYKDKTLFLITHQESVPVKASVIHVTSPKEGFSQYSSDSSL